MNTFLALFSPLLQFIYPINFPILLFCLSLFLNMSSFFLFPFIRIPPNNMGRGIFQYIHLCLHTYNTINTVLQVRTTQHDIPYVGIYRTISYLMLYFLSFLTGLWCSKAISPDRWDQARVKNPEFFFSACLHILPKSSSYSLISPHFFCRI